LTTLGKIIILCLIQISVALLIILGGIRISCFTEGLLKFKTFYYCYNKEGAKETYTYPS
jgi:hypothetical protein